MRGGGEGAAVQRPVPVGVAAEGGEHLGRDVGVPQRTRCRADAGARRGHPRGALLGRTAAVAARVDMAVVGHDEEGPLLVGVGGPGAYGGEQASEAGVGAADRGLVGRAAAQDVRCLVGCAEVDERRHGVVGGVVAGVGQRAYRRVGDAVVAVFPGFGASFVYRRSESRVFARNNQNDRQSLIR